MQLVTRIMQIVLKPLILKCTYLVHFNTVQLMFKVINYLFHGNILKRSRIWCTLEIELNHLCVCTTLKIFFLCLCKKKKLWNNGNEMRECPRMSLFNKNYKLFFILRERRALMHCLIHSYHTTCLCVHACDDSFVCIYMSTCAHVMYSISVYTCKSVYSLKCC